MSTAGHAPSNSLTRVTTVASRKDPDRPYTNRLGELLATDAALTRSILHAHAFPASLVCQPTRHRLGIGRGDVRAAHRAGRLHGGRNWRAPIRPRASVGSGGL